MLPPKKHVQQQQQQPQRTAGRLSPWVKEKPLLATANWNVLAERNQQVAPVGAWVEGAEDVEEQEESLAFVTAAQIEEMYKEQQKEKAQILKRFQEEVKRRVNQRVKLRKKQQLQKSYEAALKESSVVIGFSDSALHLTPKKSTCSYRFDTDSAICSSGAKLISGQQPYDKQEWQGDGQDVQFLEQAKTISQTVQQVRRRLASCKTVSEGATSPGLPEDIVQSCPSIQKPANAVIAGSAKGSDNGEFPLVGYHDLPAELQEQETESQAKLGKDLHYTIELRKISSEIMDSRPPGSSSAISTETEAAVIFWPGLEREESKKQRQNQYLRYRRLFMDIEREQVKEQQRQMERQTKRQKIKKEKEHQRLAVEQRIQLRASQGDSNSRERACEKLEQLKLQDLKEKINVMEKRKNKESSRYVEALRVQMQEKIKMYNISLPPLCFCGSDFWDCHPDSCANNCAFYKNHRAYAQALQSVISSCEAFDGGSTTRLSAHTFAAAYAHSERNTER